MTIPSSLKISFHVECDDCNKAVTVDGPIGKPQQSIARMKHILERDNWEPIMLGKTAIGILCEDCCAEKRGDDGNDADQEEADTNVTRLETKAG